MAYLILDVCPTYFLTVSLILSLYLPHYLSLSPLLSPSLTLLYSQSLSLSHVSLEPSVRFYQNVGKICRFYLEQDFSLHSLLLKFYQTSISCRVSYMYRILDLSYFLGRILIIRYDLL